MVLPICDVCASSGVLCNACERKLGEGRITAYDVELSRMLHSMLGGEAEFIKVVETSDNLVVLAPRESVGKIIGKGGSVIKEISEKLGKHIRGGGGGGVRDRGY